MGDRKRPLPQSPSDLSSVHEVAKMIARRYRTGRSCLMLRYGDTSGRVMARPDADTPEFGYLKNFLGGTVTPDQVDLLAVHIEQSIEAADIIGLRSDLIGPDMVDHILLAPDSAIRRRLVDAYPIRDFERTRLGPDDARRLAQTRKAMESFHLPANALLTDAWVHVSLAEAGFLLALMRDAASFSIVTSGDRRGAVRRLAEAFSGRVRYFECPGYPKVESQWAGDHDFLWHRWISLLSGITPSYPGEPLFISAGIWTKALGPAWTARGGIALDIGSVMDYFEQAATRPAVLATRYGDATGVPQELSLDAQLQGSRRLDEFLD